MTKTLKQLGEQLRQRLRDAVTTLLTLKGESQLLSSNDVLDQSMRVRKPYLLPLHLLQAELMKRRRLYLAEQHAEHTPVESCPHGEYCRDCSRLTQYRLRPQRIAQQAESCSACGSFTHLNMIWDG